MAWIAPTTPTTANVESSTDLFASSGTHRLSKSPPWQINSQLSRGNRSENMSRLPESRKGQGRVTVA